QGARAPQSELRPIVGRESELGEIRRHLAKSGSRVLFISGEPGIGKTRLLEETAGLAAASGWRVVQGGCQRRSPAPYSPLIGALARSIQELPSRERAVALRGADWLGRLLPELAFQAGGPNYLDGPTDPLPVRLTPEQERRLLFAGVARYLRAVAGSAGTLLIL